MDILKTYFSPRRISQPATLRGKAARELEIVSPARLYRLYWLWKLLLLSVAIASPGPGYDTSTELLFARSRSTAPDLTVRIPGSSTAVRTIEYILLRLTRWDAIYFASSSTRGHVYEQEWAFSWVLSKFTSTAARVFFFALPLSPIAKHALAGVVVAHVSHLCAVIFLYSLVYNLVPTTQEARKRQVAFTAACLHIISPAGIFLSAPYGEAAFALFNFLGMLCYVKAVHNRFHTFADAYQLDACWTVAGGMSFAIATMMRSNGLLSGIIFAWDVIAMLPRLPQLLQMREKEQLTRLTATVLAGLLIACGFVLPQAVAYLEYCTAGNTRPWCGALPPSIYNYVQDYYWNVGFLRYWTLSNLPLFALAFPMAWIMVETALPCVVQIDQIGKCAAGKDQPDAREQRVLRHVLPRLALPQIILVGLAATSFHCQIINRISSGYPVWYLVLAIAVGDKEQKLFWAKPEWIVRGMVVYAIVQCGLYAAFMPPA